MLEMPAPNRATKIKVSKLKNFLMHKEKTRKQDNMYEIRP